MQACDDLYDESDAGDSTYERYGDTCAGRQPENTRRLLRDAFPELTSTPRRAIRRPGPIRARR